MPTSTIAVEAKLDGSNWTAITADVVASAGIRIKCGITSSRLDDRVAGTGTMTLTLNNSASNSGGLVGYYTPGHTNCRSGFAADLPVRLRVTSGAVTRTKFYGRIAQGGIMPIPGQYDDRKTSVTVLDWMQYPADEKLGQIPYKASQNMGTTIAMVEYYMVSPAPLHKDIDAGLTTFDAIFEPAGNGLKGLTEFVRAANSELGWVYIRRDATYDEILRAEHRHARNEKLFEDSPLYEFDNDMSGGELEAIVKGAKVTLKAYPRSEDTSAVVLHALQGRIFIAAGDSVTITGRYSDPENKAKNISAREVYQPVPVTDYSMWSNEDGTGTDLTNDLDITISAGANSIEYTMENSGSTDGWALVQCRGIGIYSYDSIEVVSEPATVKTEIFIDTKYQDNPEEAQGLADYLRDKIENANDIIWKSVTFYPNRSDALMTAFLTGDIGDHIRITEEMSGAVDQDYFINGVGIEILPGQIIRCTWYLMWDVEPTASYWILEESGRSELDDTTVLAP